MADHVSYYANLGWAHVPSGAYHQKFLIKTRLVDNSDGRNASVSVRLYPNLREFSVNEFCCAEGLLFSYFLEIRISAGVRCTKVHRQTSGASASILSNVGIEDQTEKLKIKVRHFEEVRLPIGFWPMYLDHARSCSEAYSLQFRERRTQTDLATPTCWRIGTSTGRHTAKRSSLAAGNGQFTR